MAQSKRKKIIIVETYQRTVIRHNGEAEGNFCQAETEIVNPELAALFLDEFSHCPNDEPDSDFNPEKVK